jgi:cysteine dioxygenase
MAGSTTGPNSVRNSVTVAAEPLGIEEWVKGLAAIPEHDFTLETVQNYVVHHGVRPESLDKYCYFSKGSYTRNLIFKNDVFECMTVCWEIGQHSRVHNHRDQNCWMSVPIGRLRVQNYRVEHRDSAHGTCKISPSDIYEMDAAHPAYVNPLEPVHEVINATEFNKRAVSIHVYSKPFDTCEVYLRDKGTYSDVPLFYTSEYGELNPAEKLF